MTRLEKRLIQLIEKAKTDFALWNKGEKLLLCISGGKDSLALYVLLKTMQVDFNAIHVNLSPEFSTEFISDNELDSTVIETDIYNDTHKKESSKNPCFLCTRERRKRILNYAAQHGFRKICFAHTKNDVWETLLLNIFYSREISTMNPNQEIFNGKFQIIRPMYYVEENLIRKYINEKDLKPQINKCPEDKSSKRSYIREIVEQISENHPKIDLKDNIFSSCFNVNHDFLPKKLK